MAEQVTLTDSQLDAMIRAAAKFERAYAATCQRANAQQAREHRERLEAERARRAAEQ